MYVYLKYGTAIKRFVDVELVDFIQPQVDGISVPGTDPNVWFKVLILDSILIDCDSREVYWNKEAVVEATNIHWNKDEDLEVAEVWEFFQTQGKMFEGGCHDFVVDVDELFETGKSIVNELELGAENIEESEAVKIKQKLFRLLHIFILPKLVLRKSELKDLQSALDSIEQQQKDVGINIATKEKIRYRTGRFLEKQRIAMLTSQDFSSERSVSGFNYQFLEHFLKHIETDIREGNKGMDEFENKIAPLRTCQTLQQQEMLNYWRDQRDKTWSHINKAVNARETIKNVIVRPWSIKDNRTSVETVACPDHIVYSETSIRLQGIENEIRDLREAMIKLTSMRDTVVQAISEIIEHGQTRGKFEKTMELGLQRNADPDEWTTLSKKIDSLVTAKPLGFRDKHRKFCEKVDADLKKLTDASKPRASCILDYQAISHEKNTRKSVGSLQSKTGFVDQNQNVNVLIENICSDVIKHILGMTNSLAEELYKTPRSEIQASAIENIYICYESYVSGELMPILYKVFEESSKHQCEALTRSLSQVALSDNLLASIDSIKSVQKQDATHDRSRRSETSETIEIQDILDKFATFVKGEAEEKMSVFTNMRNVMEIFQYIIKHSKKFGRSSNPMCTDDILDVIIPLLQKLDPEIFLKFNAHINLLINLKPYFVEGCGLHFALINFNAAFSYLFNQNQIALNMLPK